MTFTKIHSLIDAIPSLSLTRNGLLSLERAVLRLAMGGELADWFFDIQEWHNPDSGSARDTRGIYERLPSSHTALLEHASRKDLFISCPKHWHVVRLGDIAQIVGGGTPSTDNPENFDEDGIPWLTPADLRGIKSKYIDRGRRSLSNAGLANCSAQKLPKHSVVFSSRAPIGYVAVNTVPLCTNQGFKSIVPKDLELTDYLYYYLKFASVDIDRNAPGTTFREVSGRYMKSLTVPMPPREERKQIVERLDVFYNYFYELENSMFLLNEKERRLELAAQYI